MGKFSLEEINNMYIDVLKEIGNIGAGNATTAIAKMIGARIDMGVPSVKLMEVSELGTAVGAEDDTVIGIFLEVQNDIKGSMMFLLDMESGHHLVNTLMGRKMSYNEPFNEMDISALKEVGNIIAASYLTALSTLTKMSIVPSVPYIAIDMAAAVLSVPAIQFGMMGDNALMIQTAINADVSINGYFILMPEPESYDMILNSLGIEI